MPWHRTALAQDPLNAHALRILGQLADAADNEAAAARFMQAAVHRSLRESVAVFWLMRESFERKDYATAVRYARHPAANAAGRHRASHADAGAHRRGQGGER